MRKPNREENYPLQRLYIVNDNLYSFDKTYFENCFFYSEDVLYTTSCNKTCIPLTHASVFALYYFRRHELHSDCFAE